MINASEISAEKTCSRCGVAKGLSEFDKHPSMTYGYFNQCKACRRAANAVRSARKRDEAKRQRRIDGVGFRGDIDTLPLEPGELVADIPEFPGYRASNFGRIQSCFVFGTNRMSDEWRDVKQHCNDKGYMQVTLYRNGKRYMRLVQSLVLSTFVGPRPSPEHEACHFPDRTPSNNRLDNLRWDTISANHMDKHEHGTMPIGSNHKRSKMTEENVLEIRRMFAEGAGPAEISRKFGISDVQVYNIVKRKHWRHI